MKEADARRLESEINEARNGIHAVAEKSVYHRQAWHLTLTRQHNLTLCASSVGECREILIMWALLSSDLEEVA